MVIDLPYAKYRQELERAAEEKREARKQREKEKKERLKVLNNAFMVNILIRILFKS